jgi:CHAT domain-containing protein
MSVAADSADTASLVAALKQKSQALANASLSVAELGQENEHREQLSRFADEVERAQQALAEASAPFRRQLDEQRVTPANVQQALPESTALIDLFEYICFLRPEERTGKSRWDFRLAAFIVRRNEPVERVEIGPVLSIYEAIRFWRWAFVPILPEESRRPSDPEPLSKPEAARRVRESIWSKLEPHLSGVKMVLVSPDGITARLPWSAIEGNKPGTYLIEDYAIGVVPIPRLLVQSSDKPVGPPSNGIETSSRRASLLVVGDVNYDGDAGQRTTSAIALSAPRMMRSGQLQHWSPLAGTRAEMAALAASFKQSFPDGRLDTLAGSAATKRALLSDLEGHRYVHLATHGFFAPKELSSLLDDPDTSSGPSEQGFSSGSAAGYPPGLLSGLVLAGANQPAAVGRDDGVLTALEVGQLNLDGVELATLSACETGLGRMTQGEGVFGLQRAFQIAGAKSVVSTLWRVNDDATRVLMADFYKNLWEKKLSKIEALRQAQLKMLAAPTVGGSSGRGLKFDDSQPPDENRRLPPYYWAPFVLSGEWR